MTNGAQFPKKSETDETPDTPAPQVEIQRSDDPNFSTSKTSGSRNLPAQSKKVGCGSSVFVLMLLVAVVLVGRTII